MFKKDRQMDKITAKQGQKLLQIARKAIADRLDDNSTDVARAINDPTLFSKRGTFVTLKLKGQLRGCIGNIEPHKSLVDSISDNAVSAAFEDYRFSKLSQDEFEQVHLSISILSEPQQLAYEGVEDLLLKIRANIDGVILRVGRASATFLPQVWQQLPTVEQFLSHLCLKAGLTEDRWKEAGVEILVYQAQYFEEENK